MNKPDSKEVMDKCEAVSDSIKDSATRTYENLMPKAEGLVNSIQETASDFYKMNKERLAKAEDFAEETINTINQTIRKQPLSSILIAAGIGYLLSKMKK